MSGYRYIKFDNTVPEDFDLTEEVGDYQLNEEKLMNGLFKMTKEDFLRGLMLGVITGVIAMLGYVLKVGSVFGIDLRSMLDVGVVAAIPAIISWLGSLLTTSRGNMLGVAKVE